MKSKKIIKTLSLVILSFSLFFINSCSSDDDTNNPNNPTSGAPHTYEFTITGGQLDGEVISGIIENIPQEEVPEDAPIATSAYTSSNDIPNTKVITYFIKDDQININGFLAYNTETETAENFGEPLDKSNLSFSVLPSDEFSDFLQGAYFSTPGGSVSLTQVKLLSFLGTAGVASFQLDFEGTFVGPLVEEDENIDVFVSGTIVINVPVDDEWMEFL